MASSVTREVILKLRTEMAKATPQASSFKDILSQFPKATKEIRDQLLPLRTATRLWQEHAKAIGAAAEALRKYRQSQQPDQTQSKRTTNSSGSNSFSGLGRLAPPALVAAAGGIGLNELRSFMPNWWGQQLHGGFLRRGSMPFVEGIADTLTGRDQREQVEDYRRQSFDIGLHEESGIWQSRMGYRRNMENLSRGALPFYAGPRDELRLLQQQLPPMHGESAALGREQTQLYKDFNEEMKRLKEVEQQRLQQAEQVARQVQQAPAVNGGLMDKLNMIPIAGPFGIKDLWEGAKKAPVAGPFNINDMFAAGGQVVGMAGGNAMKNQSESEQVEARVNLQKNIIASLEKQSELQKEISANLFQQLSITKQIAAQRAAELGGNVSGFARMNQFERGEVVDVADRIRKRQVISPEQEALARRVPELSRQLDENAIGNVMASGEFGRLQRAMGTPEDKIKELQGQFQQASFSKLFTAQPIVNIVAQIDNDALASSIVKQLNQNFKDQLVTNVAISVNQAMLSRGQLRQAAIRSAMGGLGADNQ